MRLAARKMCLCYPGTKIKSVWTIITSIALIAACFMTPFGLAFEWLDYNEGLHLFVFNDVWNSLDSIIDIIFILEIIVCFNSSYYDSDRQDYVSDRCEIAKRYTRSGWFWIDLFAIIPRFLRPFEHSENVTIGSEILSFVKGARIGRLIKLVRLLKMAKTIKHKENLK